MSELAQNYFAVQERIEKALLACGRSRSEVTLLAVSKFQPVEAILELANLGHKDFGESRIEEALAKIEAVAKIKSTSLELELDKIHWHLIGHIQSRKAVQISKHFQLIHSLDSLKLAKILEKQNKEQDIAQDRDKSKRQAVLIEVNLAKEEQKSGVAKEEVEGLLENILKECPHLEVQGLMCIPPVESMGAKARPYFAKLYELREDLRRSSALALPHLSMGMSADFAEAILEGATIIRIGTDIFGKRLPKI